MTYTNEEILILSIGALGLGMYLLFKGGDWTIDAAVYLAKKFGLSPLIIGSTIVAFGTSLPELIVSVNANLTGSPGIAIGNVIGSNIANILCILGLTSLFATLVAVPRDLMRDIIMMLLSCMLMVALMLYGQINALTGGLMIAILIGYVFWQYAKASKGEITIRDLEEPAFAHALQGLMFLIMGLIAISVGAEFLVRGAVVSAAIIGVPEDVIGLSVIALGTSLPELSTCIIAALKRQSDIVIGNILGSNIFNILMIIGLVAIVKPIEKSSIASQVIVLDIWVMLGVSVLFAFLLIAHRKINKPIGIVLLAGYVLYIGTIYALYLTKDAVVITG